MSTSSTVTSNSWIFPLNTYAVYYTKDQSTLLGDATTLNTTALKSIECYCFERDKWIKGISPPLLAISGHMDDIGVVSICLASRCKNCARKQFKSLWSKGNGMTNAISVEKLIGKKLQRCCNTLTDKSVVFWKLS